jgi:hypothetical protein
MPNRGSRPDTPQEASMLDWLAALTSDRNKQRTQSAPTIPDEPFTHTFRNKYDAPIDDEPDPSNKLALGLHPLTGLALYALNGVTPIPDVHVDFRQLDLRGIRCPKDEIIKKARELANKKLPVGPIDIMFSERTNGLDQLSLGFITFRIKGALHIVNQEFWNFKGSIMGADYDSYDFLNRGSPHRNDVENRLTDLGALIPGKRYKIYFHGEQPYEDTGTY